MQLAITIIQLIACLIIIGVVMLQSGKSAGLSGVLGGNNDSFLARNKAKSLDARLARITKWVAAVFMVLTLILGLI